MSEILYEDKYVKLYHGCSSYCFNERCNNCSKEMYILHEDGRNTYGTEYIYWCPNCGTILKWYDSNKIQEDNWKTPKTIDGE